MALETGTYISDLVSTNPVSNDPKNAGDDHLRLLKATIKATFPNISGAVTPTHTELNFVDGVTSAIQTQLDAKAPLASPVLTGAPTAPTPITGDNSTKIATTAFVVATALSSSLPGQVGKNKYLLSTDGTTADWYNTIDTSVVTPVAGTALATTTGTQSLSNKTLTTPILQDSSDNTKKANIVLSGVTAGQNRSITVEDANILLKTPGWVFLSRVVASTSATVDLETTIDGTYDDYIVMITDVKLSAASPSLYVRLKISGVYHSGAADYIYTRQGLTDVVSVSSDFSGQAQIPIMPNVYNTSDRYFSGWVRLHAPADTTVKKQVTWEGTTYQDIATDNINHVRGAGVDVSSNSAVTGIRFLGSTGNINSGTFTLFGIRKG